MTDSSCFGHFILFRGWVEAFSVANVMPFGFSSIEGRWAIGIWGRGIGTVQAFV